MKTIHITVPNHDDASLEGYILDCEMTLGQDVNRPAIVICPGGGYLYCSPREAEPVALRYAANGYHAFILRYSTGRKAGNFAPLDEVSWVIGLLRENAAQWHIDPDKILTCGFSAGGHLAMAAGVMAENKPNGMILSYPAPMIPNIPGADFMLKLLTGRETVTDADANHFNLLTKITKDAPPVFLVATAEDMLTPGGALAIANAYQAQGLGYELHIFQHGPHGYSLADATSADGSSRMLNDAYAHWLDLSVSWLKKVFGQPQFIDKSTSVMAQKLKELGYAIPGQENA